ncbi:DUF1639 family protein [Fagus crenata]
MATAPVKSQPLHNFSLPFLKWGGKSHTNSTSRCRRNVSPASSEPDSDYHHDSDTPVRVGSRSARNRFGVSPCSFSERPHNNSKHSVADDVKERKREAEGEAETEEAEVEAAEAEEAAQKPWNLRPRKAVQRSAMVEIGAENTTVTTVLAIPAAQQQSENPSWQAKSMRLRGMAAGESQSTEKKKEKSKFWIALSKEEIEEDVFIMTGSRPARRPRKRSKIVQKQLDSVFPGLWLVGTTADSYRVAEAPAKR